MSSPLPVSASDKASAILQRINKSYKHVSVVEGLGEMGKPVYYWHFFYLLGLANIVIPLTLSFYNPSFAQNDQEFFSGMWITYLIGTTAVTAHIYLYDYYATFCHPMLVYNHILEFCILLCFRGWWWTGVQLWTWCRNPFSFIVIIGGFVMEWFLYLVALWGRHSRTCSDHNDPEKNKKDFAPWTRTVMKGLDLIWAGAQIAQLVVGIMFNQGLLA